MGESIAEKKRPKFFEEGCEHRQKENSLKLLSEEEKKKLLSEEEEEKKREKTAASVDCCSGDKQCFPDWADLLRMESMGKPQIFDIENWVKENPLVPKEYSFEEKRMLKALADGEEYDKWEKENRLWEIQNGLVHRLQELNSRPKQNFNKMVEELNSRPLTMEEERLKQLYLENRDKASQGLNTVPFDPYGPGWELAYYTGPGSLHQLSQKIAGRPPARAPSRVPLDQRGAVPQRQQGRSTTVSRSPCAISTEEKREKLAAEGRCLIGLYLTPYCKCDLHKCSGGSKFQSDEYPSEKVPIQLAHLRQCRQSHYFDIDDHPGTPVGAVRFGSSVDPLEPFQDFNGNAELLKELANRAIQEYNEKECNVFKYKVLKIEKVNCSLSRYRQYWMTVKVLNLTLGTPIETFQIHAGISFFGDDKKTYCCRLKEEAIVGLPSCEFCFGLLSEGHITGRKEEALEL